ncbi:hypothetical protein F5146DRAFT_1116770, partial [Armillaria mellea]
MHVLTTWHGQEFCHLLDMGAHCFKAVDTIALPEHSVVSGTPALALGANFRNLYIHGHDWWSIPTGQGEILLIRSLFTMSPFVERNTSEISSSTPSQWNLSLISLEHARNLFVRSHWKKILIRSSSLIDILYVVPGLTRLELRDPVLGSFIPYCPVSQALPRTLRLIPCSFRILESIEFIWKREDTGRKLKTALMEMVETRSMFWKMKD